MYKEAMFASLQNLDDELFAERALSMLLGRKANPESIKECAWKLASGEYTREQIWDALVNSEQGRLNSARKELAKNQKVHLCDINKHLPSQMLSGWTVEKLLSSEGPDFVHGAYRALLGREPDPTGLSFYLSRLQSGDSKVSILKDLSADSEGRAYGAIVEGMDQIMNQQAQVMAKVPNIKHVDDLMGLTVESFLQGAYVCLFRREPDEEGKQIYLSLLAKGYSRSFILDKLIGSPEARDKSSDLVGLRQHLKFYKKAQSQSLIGWYYRNVKGAESDLIRDREARMLFINSESTIALKF